MQPSRVLPFLLLPLALLGCGGDGDESGGPPPGGSLTVSSVRPPDGSTTADPLSPVVVTFGAALASATVTTAAFPITRDGLTLAATASYDAASRSVELDAPLVPGASYDAAVETTVEGEGGEQLEQRFEWSFATRSWEATTLGPSTGFRGLSLTAEPDGTLHLLYWAPAAGGGHELEYATCATQCLIPANWSAVAVDQANSGGPVAILADGGSLHIAYQNSSNAELLYGTCSSGCTAQGAWQSVVLDLGQFLGEGHEAIGLGRDGTGRLHLVTIVGTGGSQYGLAYASCAGGCTNAASWQATLLAPTAQSASLLAEPGGRLHATYRDPATSTLRYATCSAGCGSPASWTDISADPTAITSTGIALARGDDGSLHLAYLAQGGVRYAACDAGCDTPGGWQSTGIAPAGNLDVHVALALGEAGRIHVGFGRTGSDGGLEYATCVRECAAAESWQVTEALPGADPRHLSLVPDPSGGLHVALEDVAGASTTKYAE